MVYEQLQSEELDCNLQVQCIKLRLSHQGSFTVKHFVLCSYNYIN